MGHKFYQEKKGRGRMNEKTEYLLKDWQNVQKKTIFGFLNIIKCMGENITDGWLKSKKCNLVEISFPRTFPFVGSGAGTDV